MTRPSAPEPRLIGEVRSQQHVAVSGVIRSSTAMALRGCPACRYRLADGTGDLDLMFLGRITVPGLVPGRRCRAEGTAATRDGRIVLWNPRYQVEADRSDITESDIFDHGLTGSNLPDGTRVAAHRYGEPS